MAVRARCARSACCSTPATRSADFKSFSQEFRIESDQGARLRCPGRPVLLQERGRGDHRLVAVFDGTGLGADERVRDQLLFRRLCGSASRRIDPRDSHLRQHLPRPHRLPARLLRHVRVHRPTRLSAPKSHSDTEDRFSRPRSFRESLQRKEFDYNTARSTASRSAIAKGLCLGRRVGSRASSIRRSVSARRASRHDDGRATSPRTCSSTHLRDRLEGRGSAAFSTLPRSAFTSTTRPERPERPPIQPPPASRPIVQRHLRHQRARFRGRGRPAAVTGPGPRGRHLWLLATEFGQKRSSSRARGR